MPEAVRYRVQIAETEQFQTLRFDGLLDKPQLRGLDLPDGDYVMRQRGVDREGLEGTDGYHSFTVDARPEPPVILGPPDKALLGTQAIVLRWAQPEGAASYRVQVSSDESFEQLVVDEPAWRDNQYELSQDLAPGTYFWRLATRSKRGENGPLGDRQQFKRLAEAPALQTPGIDDDYIVFRWTAGLPGDRYELQFASDQGFESLVAQATTNEPSYQVARPAASGTYYLRVRTIDTDGDTGPFGTTQQVKVPPSSYWPLAVPVLMILFAI